MTVFVIDKGEVDCILVVIAETTTGILVHTYIGMDLDLEAQYLSISHTLTVTFFML